MNPLQWGVSKLFEMLDAIRQRAARQQAVIGSNNARVVEMYQRADGITDANKRAAVRGALEAWAARQVKIQQRAIDFAKRFRQSTEAVKAWLKSAGVASPAGLGLAPAIVVPAAIVAAVIVAERYVRYLESANETQRRGLELNADILNQVAAGTLTPEQGRALMEQNRQLADQESNRFDPLGLGQLADSLIPLAAIVAGMLIIPRVLELLPRGGGSRRAVRA